MVLAKQVSLGSSFWLGRFQGTLQPLSEGSLPVDPMWFLIITKLRKKNTEHYFMACKTVDDHTLLHF